MKRDEGMSLVELMVALGVTTLVVLIAFAALSAMSRTESYTDGNSRALAAIRLANQRMVKELRQAAKVYSESSTRAIKFWVDDDGDNQQDASERITWALRASTGGGVELTRHTDADTTPATWVDGLVLADTFTYNLVPPRTTLVQIVLEADVDDDGDRPSRTVRTDVRLRNAKNG